MKQLGKIKFKRLNAAGFGHHAVIIVLVIAGFASFGAWRILDASAASAKGSNVYTVGTQEGCELVGRKWTNNKCEAKKCANSSDKYARTNFLNKRIGYCKGHVSVHKLPSNGKNCINKLKRKYVKNVGCARVASQKDTANAKQCQAGFPNYKVDARKKTDRCVAASGTGRPAPNSGTPGVDPVTKRDITKPAILAQTEEMKATGQWESIDPRTGYSYAQQAALWTTSRQIADQFYKLKTEGVAFSQNGFGPINKDNAARAYDWYKTQTSTNYGSWRWINEDPTDNLYNQYSPTKKFVKYDPAAGGFNPNYFASQSEQDAWISKYKIIVDESKTIFGSGTTAGTQSTFKYADPDRSEGMLPGFTASPSAYSPGKNGISPFRANKPLL